MQGDAAVRRVERLAALPRLGVDLAAGAHEGRYVGYGVHHAVAVAGPSQVQGLVEVGGALGVDSDERH